MGKVNVALECVKKGSAESKVTADFAVSRIVVDGTTLLLDPSDSSREANIASISWLPNICFNSMPEKEKASGLQL